MGTDLTRLPSWKALEAHYKSISATHLRDLFARDPGRNEHFSLEAAGLYFDYSKHRVTGETVKLLVRLAEECTLKSKIRAMFDGEKINITEKRAALHTALRTPKT